MAAEKPSSDARKARLARALKANIVRRKAQARAQQEVASNTRPAGDERPETPPDEDGCPN